MRTGRDVLRRLAYAEWLLEQGAHEKNGGLHLERHSDPFGYLCHDCFERDWGWLERAAWNAPAASPFPLRAAILLAAPSRVDAELEASMSLPLVPTERHRGNQ